MIKGFSLTGSLNGYLINQLNFTKNYPIIGKICYNDFVFKEYYVQGYKSREILNHYHSLFHSYLLGKEVQLRCLEITIPIFILKGLEAYCETLIFFYSYRI